MLLKNEFKFLFSKRNILIWILVFIGVLSVYFFKYNNEYEQYASNQITYYYKTLNEENQRINILPEEKLNVFFREDSIYCQKLLSDWKNDMDAKIIAKDMYDRDQNILKYIDSGMDLSNFKSILQNNTQDLKRRIQTEKTYIENEYYDFVYQNKPTGCYLIVQFLKGNNLFFYLFMILILMWNVDIWSKDLENNTFRYVFTIGKSRKYVYIVRTLLHLFITLLWSILFFIVLYLIGYIHCGSGTELLIGTTPVVTYLSHHFFPVFGWVLFSASCMQCLSLFTKNTGMSLMLTGLLFVFMYTYLHIETLWAYTVLFFIGAICIQVISCLYLERSDLG